MRGVFVVVKIYFFVLQLNYVRLNSFTLVFSLFHAPTTQSAWRRLSLGTCWDYKYIPHSVRIGSWKNEPCERPDVVRRNRTGKSVVKAESILAKLNELRHEAEGDKTDLEYLALHHAFCFLSYRMVEFQAYLNEVADEEGD
jgi:hypothetical protein